MRIRKLLLLLGAIFLSIAVFIINAVTKNIDLEESMIQYVRSAFVVISFAMVYGYVHIVKRERQRSAVKNIRDVALFAGLFLATYLLISFLPLKGFDSREFKLFPRDYLTILFSSTISAVAGVFGIVTIHFIKDLVLHKRKKTTARNYWILLGSMIVTSLSALMVRPLDQSSVIIGILYALSILMIIANSFRLGWIAYLPRKEKIYSLLYSLLAFFGFLAILIILSIQDGWTQKGILYYNAALFTFVRLSSIFGAVYFGMAFSSTLFHLPTAEAFDRKQSEISSLHNLNRLINQVFDLKELADTATKMVTEVVQASCVWLEIIPTETGVQTDALISAYNISNNEVNAMLSGNGTSIRSTVIQTKKVLMVEDVAEDKRTSHLPQIKKAGSLLVIPLLSHDHVIGILYATKEISYGFERDDIDILSGFADQVAIAIENARLITKSIEKERLQRELMLAQEMQKRLLPQQLPKFATLDMEAISSPALEVGGDYYDVVQLNEEQVGIVIGDVSGKGVGAAFYMAEVKGIFQSLSKISSSPKDFLIKANDALVTSIDKRSFISLIYSVINTRTGELVVSRAGHCPMLYISGSRKEFIKPLGLGLGLKAGKIFEETVEERNIKMKSGDVCVFYTDGVTESRSSSGEEFGYERLLDVVDAHRKGSAEDIKEAIIQNVWSYTDAKGYHDDLTVFVVKWIGV
ncbi:MAG: SpoIIE family protein phosphatase [Bacteroidota bacterium]|nr:SpoIIE family protein phosphatase [Bacteroidota bacterium]